MVNKILLRLPNQGVCFALVRNYGSLLRIRLAKRKQQIATTKHTLHNHALACFLFSYIHTHTQKHTHTSTQTHMKAIELDFFFYGEVLGNFYLLDNYKVSTTTC